MGDPQVVSERGRRVSMPGSGNRTAVGRRSEHAAAEYLERQGYEIIERNYFTRFGEIDLVALSPEGELVFAEVKYRTTRRDGGGVAAVNRRKIHTMRHVALLWLAARRGQGEQRFARDFDLRFDVIDMGPEGLREHIEGVW